MTADTNRQRWPWVATLLDDFRTTFGPGVRVSGIRENGVYVAGAAPKREPRYVPSDAMVEQWDSFVAAYEKTNGPIKKNIDRFHDHCCKHWRG